MCVNNSPYIKAGITTELLQANFGRSSYLPQLLQVVNNAVWLVDSSLKIVAQNESAEVITGWSCDEVVGYPISALVAIDSSSTHRLCQILEGVVQQGEMASFAEGLLFPRKKGRSVLVGGRAMPIADDGLDGAIVAFWEIAADKDQEYLRFEFATMASHLFRSPLSFIHAAIDFMLATNLEEHEQRDLLMKMRSQSQRLTKLTNQLLKLLHIENDEEIGSIEAIELSPIIQQQIVLAAAQNPSNTYNYVQPLEPIPTVTADPTKLEMILLSLLLNGAKRCPEGGEINIEVKVTCSEVVVTVSDSGENIPPHQLERIFWQFYPVDGGLNKMPSNYNLGLYNIKRLVEAQNGRIWVTSDPGQSSQFSFSMPVWEK